MTREEERKIAAKERADWHQTKEEILNNCKSQLYLYDRIYNSEIASFEAGAIWSDNHPKCPWISVKDDLPYNHEELLLDNGLATKKVFVLINATIPHYIPMTKFSKWDWLLADVTHWMPFPELPK